MTVDDTLFVRNNYYAFVSADVNCDVAAGYSADCESHACVMGAASYQWSSRDPALPERAAAAAGKAGPGAVGLAWVVWQRCQTAKPGSRTLEQVQRGQPRRTCSSRYFWEHFFGQTKPFDPNML